MKPLKRQEWEIIRAKGFTRYVLLHGFIWALISGTTSIIFQATFAAVFSTHQHSVTGRLGSWAWDVIFGSMLGSVIAIVRWIANEVDASGALRTDHDE